MSNVVMYTTKACGFCLRAEQLLQRKGVRDITKVRVDLLKGAREEMKARTGRGTVPQIFIGDVHAGGYDDLAALDRAGKLDALLCAAVLTNGA